MDFNIDDAQVKAVLDDFCKAERYSTTISDNVGGTLPNPEAPLQFMQRKILENVQAYVQGNVYGVQKDRAAAAVPVPTINVTLTKATLAVP